MTENETSWYNNKELFEQLTQNKDELIKITQSFTENITTLRDSLSKDITDIKLEMRETKHVIQEYNNLRRDLTSIEKNIICMQNDINKLNERTSDIISLKDEIDDTKKKIEGIEINQEKMHTTLSVLQWVIGILIAIAGIIIKFFS